MMVVSRMIYGLCALMVAVASAAPPVIPAARRIEAKVATTLAAPADAPMHMPTDVAVDAAGVVYVADGVNDRIVRFAPQGTSLPPITGTGENALLRPVGLTVDAQGRLWVADSGHHRVLVIGQPGEAIARIDLPATEKGRAADPTDVAVTADGATAYIADNDNHRLLVRDNRSGQITVKGGFGEGLGQLQWPFSLAMAPDGYLYISESIGARVQRLNSAGRWAGQIGRWGVELGQLYRPKGIAIGPDGRLYVADSTTCVVQVFNTRGGLEGVLTDAAGGLLKFEHPMGLAFDATGRLYVVELKANRVAVVSLPQPAAASTRPVGAAGGRP